MMKKLAKKLIKSSIKIRILSEPWRIFETTAIFALKSRKKVVISYGDPQRGKVIDLIDKIKEETGMLMDDYEAYQIFVTVKGTEKVNGDIAEVGVYRGGSARLICEAKGDRSLHLFDTFKGLPRADEVDSPWFWKGKYSACQENVKSCLREYKNVYFYEGVFPATAGSLKDKRFSFVHLDTDVYRSTLDCLEFFYPRMEQGGVLISHDYSSAEGVRKAFDEFFNERKEPIVELSGSQCLIVKL